MNLDDPSILSAYFDGELDPAARLRVEAALRSEPRLAHRLRDLVRLREALNGLPRPSAPEDLAPAVVSRIEQAEAHRRRRRRERSVQLRRFLVLAPVTAAAASLLIAWAIDGLTRPEPVRFRPGVPELAHRNEPPSQRSTLDLDRPPRVESDLPGELAEIPPPTVSPTLDDRRLVGQNQLRELLGRPEARRVVLAVDRLDSTSVGRVEDAIGDTVRSDPRHARIQIPAGLAIDPRHPGEAIVFAVPLEQGETKRFLAQLEKRFPGGGLEVRPVPPELIAQLTETVAVEFGEDRTLAASPLLESPERKMHADKRDRRPDSESVTVFSPPVGLGAGSELVVVAPEPPADPPGPANRAPRPESQPPDPAVCLIWLVQKAR